MLYAPHNSNRVETAKRGSGDTRKRDWQLQTGRAAFATQAATSCCPFISAEFFPLLQSCEKRERSSIGCYRSGQILKLRRTLNRPPSSYVRIRREFEYSFNAFVREI
jgi:hypothetical protein